MPPDNPPPETGCSPTAEALDRRFPTYYGAAWVALGRIMLTTKLLDDLLVSATRAEVATAASPTAAEHRARPEGRRRGTGVGVLGHRAPNHVLERGRHIGRRSRTEASRR